MTGGDQQATRRLRVGQDELLGLGERTPLGGGVQPRVVAAGTARDHAALREVERTREHRDGGRLDPGRRAARLEHLPQMPEQPEPGDVGGRGGAGLDHGSGRGGVQRGHGPYRGLRLFGRGAPPLDGGRDQARPDRLRQEQLVAGGGGRVAHQPVGIGEPEGNHAVDRLGGRDRVAADDDRPRLGGHVLAALQDARQQVERKVIDRPRGDVQRHGRLPTHRVYVAERVGRGDAAPVVRVVDDRREHVDRRDQRAPVADPPRGRVVTGLGRHQDLLGHPDRAEHAHHRAEIARTQLARATRTVAERGQSHVGLHRASLREDAAST